MSADSLGGYQSAYSQAPDSVGLAVLDTDTRYVFADPAYCRIAGEECEGLAGSPVSWGARPRVGSTLLLTRVLTDGASRTHVTPSSRCTWHRLTIHGEVVGVVGVIVETAPASAGELQAAPSYLSLAETGEGIGTTLDTETTCLEVVSYLSPGVADAAAVDLLPSSPLTTGDVGREDLHGVYRAVVSGREELLGHSSRDAVPLSVRAMRAGRPVLDERRLAMPLIADNRAIGAVLVARTHGRFTQEDVRSVQAVSARAAIAIEHARQFEQAQRTAFKLQRALLTDPGLPHPNIELATRYLPSGSGSLVGGDWFETVRLHFGRTLLVMGDVMGHGVEAAVDMNSYRSTLREVAANDLPPHRVLRQLDNAISEAATRRPATCLLVRVDPARGMGSFASAGHLPPALFSRDGVAELIDVPVGPPLGTGLGGYEIVSRGLQQGDTLLLFTDGLVERRREDIDASLARLAQVHAGPGSTVDELLDIVLDELDAEHAEDDVAVMAARIRRKPVVEHH
ncbi:PP2C family protein-serine/threonine phosphatase [Streptomyces sp. NPDC001820]|uniref:PP2C family protein-serine/threonine phosphatase n=1 Tax=Streptomyces sp. NPDC001820 TaxID=3364613 RepID=UPI003673CABB